MRLTQAQENDLSSRGVSRRSFGQIASLIAAGASSLPLFSEMAYAQAARLREAIPAGAVLINANENPMGPSKEGLESLYKAAQNGGRYQYDLIDTLEKILSEQEGVKNDYVRITYGSSPPLHQSTLAFTSPTKSLVMADPSYESAAGAAKITGAKVHRVPLTKEYAHDVKAMAAADPNAGLIYIVNPNNPTGTLTPKEDIEWLVANKPKGAIVMIDEAYNHIAGAPFNSNLVAADKDVILLRTFSKIYGMAGLRAGMLQQKDLVPSRRKTIADIRNDTFEYLGKNNFHYVPSVSNCFMVDVKQPAMDIVMALRKENIYIGRVWPAWPTHVRVTVGTKEEMAKFKTAFSKVMA